MRICAIDPGVHGGLAFSDGYGVSACNMLDTIHELRALLYNLSIDEAVVEDVGFHVAGNNAVASARFAFSVGEIHGLLAGLLIPFRTVRPQKWMKHYSGLPKGMDKKKERKNAIKAHMQRRYPHIKVTLATADALAILTHAMETKP